MDYIENQALFNIGNYDFIDINTFRNEFLNSKSCQEISGDFIEQKVVLKIDGKTVDIAELDNPIIVFGNASCQIIYDNLNKLVQIKTNDFINNKQKTIDLLNTLAQFRLQEINCITINFLNKCNNKENKLSVFNEHIHEKLSSWNYNTGFNVRIPIQEPDKEYSEDYRISKVSGGENAEVNINDYIYQVVCLYTYKIEEDKANTKERLSKLERIITSVDGLYAKFSKKCEEIMNL